MNMSSKTNSKKIILLAFCIFFCNLFSCGGGVDEEQMESLNNIKAEVESLRAQVKAKEDEKASLQKQISDKDAKIKRCNNDYQKTKKEVEEFEDRYIKFIINSDIKSHFILVNAFFYKRSYSNQPSLEELKKNIRPVKEDERIIEAGSSYEINAERNDYKFIFYDFVNSSRSYVEDFEARLHIGEKIYKVKNQLK